MQSILADTSTRSENPTILYVGNAIHIRYKNPLSQDESIGRELKQCADALDETDRKMQRIAEQMQVLTE
jgi:hypothetical protein